MGTNYKFIIFIIALSFGDCKNLYELQTNNSSLNHTKDTKKLSSSSHSSHCNSNADCLTSDKNFKCVDHKCGCASNYNYATNKQKCSFFIYSNDIEFRTYDERRHCESYLLYMARAMEMSTIPCFISIVRMVRYVRIIANILSTTEV
jgi:hypothetical protein